MLLELALEQVVIRWLTGEPIAVLREHDIDTARHGQRPRDPAHGPYLVSQGWRRSDRGLLPPRGPRSLHGQRIPSGLRFAGRVSNLSGLARLWRRGRRG